jgi:DNA gyrase subunit B
MPAIEAILTKLHSSGKFDDKAYRVSRGTHGLGMKATNALSLELEIWTCRDGQWWSLMYSRGIKKRDLKKCKAPVSPLTGKALVKGTLVRCVPDSKIFSSLKFAPSLMIGWAEISAYFTPGFKVLLSNEKSSKEIHFPEGPKAYTKNRVEALKCTPLSPDVFIFQNALLDCVAQFTDYDGVDFAAFTNGLRNVEGGEHYNAFFRALGKAIEPFKKPKQQFGVAELREGVVGIVNAKLSAPQFDSQTKEKLVDERAGQPAYNDLVKAFTKFLNGNKALAAKICERCSVLRGLKSKFQASKEVIKEIKRVTGLGFPDKSTVAPNCPREKRELFLVEGESAYGTARQARNGEYQELLPITGKILNAMREKQEDKVLLSERVLNILAMLGFDPSSPAPYDKLRVGKILKEDNFPFLNSAFKELELAGIRVER